MTGAPGVSPAMPAGRAAGVGIHLSSLPGTCGIGDIGDSALAFLGELDSMGLNRAVILATIRVGANQVG